MSEHWQASTHEMYGRQEMGKIQQKNVTARRKAQNY